LAHGRYAQASANDNSESRDSIAETGDDSTTSQPRQAEQEAGQISAMMRLHGSDLAERGVVWFQRAATRFRGQDHQPMKNDHAA